MVLAKLSVHLKRRVLPAAARASLAKAHSLVMTTCNEIHQRLRALDRSQGRTKSAEVAASVPQLTIPAPGICIRLNGQL